MKNPVCVIIGTRPEAIKLAPVVLELQKNNIPVSVCVTGQHSDMVNPILDFFGIFNRSELKISRATGTLSELTALLLTAIDTHFTDVKPSHVIVQGDTTTAFVGALVAFYHKIPVSHVEAGLRTHNKLSPWPEEINRSLITQIADFHFAPTQLAKSKLLSNDVSEEKIFITGNTVIDALLIAKSRNGENLEQNQKEILITCHRRENAGSGMRDIFKAISILADRHGDLNFIFPMHPNPAIRTLAEEVMGSKSSNIFLRGPADYPEFVSLMNRSLIILTDSGGVQEEAPSLGKPVLVLRDTTERPEGIDAGTVRLVGTSTDRIVDEFTLLINNADEYNKMSRAQNPYGDGTAAVTIVNIISTTL